MILSSLKAKWLKHTMFGNTLQLQTVKLFVFMERIVEVWIQKKGDTVMPSALFTGEKKKMHILQPCKLIKFWTNDIHQIKSFSKICNFFSNEKEFLLLGHSEGFE